MAEINGGKFGEGLSVAAINKLLIEEIAKNNKLSPEEGRWISALLGELLNDGQGGAIADSATRNNKFSDMVNHPKEFEEAVLARLGEKAETYKEALQDFLNNPKQFVKDIGSDILDVMLYIAKNPGEFATGTLEKLNNHLYMMTSGGTLEETANAYADTLVFVVEAFVGTKGGKAVLDGTKYLSKVTGLTAKTLNFKPTSGVTLVPTPGKTTTVLGRFNDDMKYVIDELKVPTSTEFGAKPGGFNVLNTPSELRKTADQFWMEYNKPFIDAAVARGDKILLASAPTNENIFVNGIVGGELTGFGREIKYLTEVKNYVYNADRTMLVKP